MVWIEVPWFLREERPDCALIIKKASGASGSFYLRIQGHIGVVFCPVNLILKGQIRPFSSKKKNQHIAWLYPRTRRLFSCLFKNTLSCIYEPIWILSAIFFFFLCCWPKLAFQFTELETAQSLLEWHRPLSPSGKILRMQEVGESLSEVTIWCLCAARKVIVLQERAQAVYNGSADVAVKDIVNERVNTAVGKC